MRTELPRGCPWAVPFLPLCPGTLPVPPCPTRGLEGCRSLLCPPASTSPRAQTGQAPSALRPLLPASGASKLDAGRLQGVGLTLGHGKGLSPALTLAGTFRARSLLVEPLGAYPVVTGLAGLQVNCRPCCQGRRLCSRGHPVRIQTRWDTAHIQEAAWQSERTTACLQSQDLQMLPLLEGDLKAGLGVHNCMCLKFRIQTCTGWAKSRQAVGSIKFMTADGTCVILCHNV